MKKKIIAVAFCSFFFSCKSTLKTIKGIKDPKIESYSATQKYLHKKDMDTARVVYFKDFNSFAQASKKKLLQVPNALFFDKDGNFVDYRKSATDCNAKVDDFIQDLKTFNEAKKDATKTIADLKQLVVGANKNLLSEKPGEITVFITWAKFAGTLNKEKAFDWVKLLEAAKRKGLNVNYYLLNCDFQENWNLTKEEKEALGVN